MAARGRDDGRNRRRRRGTVKEPLPGDGIGFWIKGADLAPEDDPAWLELPAEHAGRKAFWEQAAELALSFYAKEREAGRDAVGRKLRRLSEVTIEKRESAMGTADKNAPPLIPAHGLSRTVSLLRYSIRKDGLWFYWGHDAHTGGTWGSILARHKAGWDVPKRDVIGLAKRVRNSIRSRMLKWWLGKRKAYSPDTAAEYSWTPSGVGREFRRPTRLDRMDGALETNREGWYQDVAGKKGRTLTPWQERFRGRAEALLGSGGVEYSLEGTNRIRGELGLPPLSGPAETPRPKLRLVRQPRPEPPVVPPLVAPPPLLSPEPTIPAVLSPLSPPEAIPPRASKPAPAPAEPSLIASFLPLPDDRWGDRLLLTQEAIRRVHGAGQLPTIPTAMVDSTKINGKFSRTWTGHRWNADGIEISRQGRHPELSYAHEIGHFLDYAGVPWLDGQKKRDYANDPHFAGWYKTVKSSRAVAALEDLRSGTGDGAASPKSIEYVNYLLKPSELWARAYAQYVATRSGVPLLKEQLERDRGNLQNRYRDRHWSDEDFAPIAEAIDTMFTKLGWRP